MKNDSSQIKIDISSYLIDEELIKSTPGALVKKYKFIPVFKIGNTLTIAMADPQNLTVIDELRKRLNTEIDALYAEPEDIENAITQYYGLLDLIETYSKDALKDPNFLPKKSTENIIISTEEMSDSPIINLINLIICQGTLQRASDIHIEPSDEEIAIRLRIDGLMSEMKKLPKSLHQPIVSRIKVMGGMDIAETRIPQDGHINLIIDKKPIEIRVSSLPTIFGENIVMRLLPKGEISFGLTRIGFSEEILDLYKKLIFTPYGIILVTGPTGSGKTTSLYAALNEINQTTKTIITLEDPVEYHMQKIRQVQVNVKAGLTFSTGLKSILRQDPDIIMVGEIRDLETAELAVRCALTGHLVLSTLHTNDAPSSLIRLVDMGIEPFLVSSVVIGVLAQRLVRKICPKCKIEYQPTEDEIKSLNLDTSKSFKKGKGCKVCAHSGYLNRTAIAELFILDEKIKELLIKRASAIELRNKAVELGMKTMEEDAKEKIYQGITTPEEVLTVIQTIKNV